jgi:hypothetical protein
MTIRRQKGVNPLFFSCFKIYNDCIGGIRTGKNPGGRVFILPNSSFVLNRFQHAVPIAHFNGE